MKLKKLFQYGFIATCLFGNAMAMDEKSFEESEAKTKQITIFKAPTVDEVKQHVIRMDDSRSFLEIGGLVLKPVIYNGDSLDYFVVMGSHLERYHATYLIEEKSFFEEKGELKVTFAYASDSWGCIELSVDFKSMGVDSGTVKYNVKDRYQLTSPGYKTSYNPDLEFKIG